MSMSNLFHGINWMEKRKKKEKTGMMMEKRKTGESPSFDYFLFDMNCYLKELSQTNILGNFL